MTNMLIWVLSRHITHCRALLSFSVKLYLLKLPEVLGAIGFLSAGEVKIITTVGACQSPQESLPGSNHLCSLMQVEGAIHAVLSKLKGWPGSIGLTYMQCHILRRQHSRFSE